MACLALGQVQALDDRNPARDLGLKELVHLLGSSCARLHADRPGAFDEGGVGDDIVHGAVQLLR